jgi:molecular chaperone GrpE
MTEESNNNQESGEESLPEETVGNQDRLSPEEQNIALIRDLEECQRLSGQNLDLAQRNQAELANYRRRTDDERISLLRYSNSRLITKVLPVIDELELAVSHAGKAGANPSWIEGVKLIQRKLSTLLESEGVTKIDAIGTMFNPLEHEAVETLETTEMTSGFVVTVVRAGYRLHDRVIQPAQVIVARERQDAPQVKNSTDIKETGNG